MPALSPSSAGMRPRSVFAVTCIWLLADQQVSQLLGRQTPAGQHLAELPYLSRTHRTPVHTQRRDEKVQQFAHSPPPAMDRKPARSVSGTRSAKISGNAIVRAASWASLILIGRYRSFLAQGPASFVSRLRPRQDRNPRAGLIGELSKMNASLRALSEGREKLPADWRESVANRLRVVGHQALKLADSPYTPVAAEDFRSSEGAAGLAPVIPLFGTPQRPGRLVPKSWRDPNGHASQSCQGRVRGAPGRRLGCRGLSGVGGRSRAISKVARVDPVHVERHHSRHCRAGGVPPGMPRHYLEVGLARRCYGKD